MHTIPDQDAWKRLAAEAGADLVEEGMLIGLGSGSTAIFMVEALARRIQGGLRILGAVPTSRRTEELAARLGIPVTTLDAHPELDLDIDGADEVDPALSLIKGGGGALLREKVVAAASRRLVIIADESKRVPILGLRFPLPVEVIPFALAPVSKKLTALGANVQTRLQGERPYLTDNGNLILDCTFTGGIPDPRQLDERLHHIVGIVESGLFLHMASTALIGGPSGLTRLP